jgi:hypothetical protein
VKVKPSAVPVPAVVWKVKSVVKFWMFTAVGYQALEAWNVGLVLVKDKALPLMVAFPFSTIEPAAKPLPKLIPPPPLEPMVYAAVATLLLAYPVSSAIAFRVSVALTVIGPLYRVEAEVGAEPFVV